MIFVTVFSICFCARKNVARISGGISLDIVSVCFGSEFSVSGVFSDSAVFSADFFLNRIFGNGIVIKGFFVRIMMVVVATYNGIAANSIIPNTKPPNPRNWACIRRCHWAPLSISKLNMLYKIAHMINRYEIVQIAAYLCVFIKDNNVRIIMYNNIDYK